MFWATRDGRDSHRAAGGAAGKKLDAPASPRTSDAPISGADLKERLRITGTLVGSGSFSVMVHRALLDGVPIALKVLPPHVASGKKGSAALEMLQREGELLQRLNHGNIVRCFAVLELPPDFPGLLKGYTKPICGLAMEILQGGSLGDILRKQLCEPWKLTYDNATALAWSMHVASALSHLHGMLPPVIHRDLCAENVQLVRRPKGTSPEGSVAKLTDFSAHVCPISGSERHGRQLVTRASTKRRQGSGLGADPPPPPNTGALGSNRFGGGVGGGGNGSSSSCRSTAMYDTDPLADADEESYGDDDGGHASRGGGGGAFGGLGEEAHAGTKRPPSTGGGAIRVSASGRGGGGFPGAIGTPPTQPPAPLMFPNPTNWRAGPRQAGGSSHGGASGRHMQEGGATAAQDAAAAAAQQQPSRVQYSAIGAASRGQLHSQPSLRPARSTVGEGASGSVAPLPPQPPHVSSFPRISLAATGRAGSSGAPTLFPDGGAEPLAQQQQQHARASGSAHGGSAHGGGNSGHNGAPKGRTSFRQLSRNRSNRVTSGAGGDATATATEPMVGFDEIAPAPPSMPPMRTSGPGACAESVHGGFAFGGGFGDGNDADDEHVATKLEQVYELGKVDRGSAMSLAPEVLLNMPQNEKADVFAYGCLLYELWGRSLLLVSHIGVKRPDMPRVVYNSSMWSELIISGWRPARVDLIPQPIYDLICECWHPDSLKRPPMAVVEARLRRMASDADLADAVIGPASGRGGKPIARRRRSTWLNLHGAAAMVGMAGWAASGCCTAAPRVQEVDDIDDED